MSEGSGQRAEGGHGLCESVHVSHSEPNQNSYALGIEKERGHTPVDPEKLTPPPKVPL